MVQKIQESAVKYRYCWVFEVGTMRNTHLKTVRSLWKECVPVVPDTDEETF